MSSDLHPILAKLIQINELAKEIEEQKAKLRQKFFKYADENHLPARQIPVRIDEEWLIRSGLTLEDYIETRYPGWRIVDDKKDNLLQGWLLILEEASEYTPFSYTDEELGFSLAREARYGNPEFDFRLFKKLEPDLYQEIVKVETVEVESLDEKKVERALDEDPELLSVLQRYYRAKKPTMALMPRKIKTDEA